MVNTKSTKPSNCKLWVQSSDEKLCMCSCTRWYTCSGAFIISWPWSEFAQIKCSLMNFCCVIFKARAPTDGNLMYSHLCITYLVSLLTRIFNYTFKQPLVLCTSSTSSTSHPQPIYNRQLIWCACKRKLEKTCRYLGANSTQKGPSWDLNQEPSFCKLTVVMTPLLCCCISDLMSVSQHHLVKHPLTSVGPLFLPILPFVDLILQRPAGAFLCGNTNSSRDIVKVSL